MVDAWLDGELSGEELPRLESWLREDPAHARELLHAAALEADLRAAYRPREAVAVPSRSAIRDLWHWFRPGLWVPVGGLAAALLVCALIYFQTHQPPPKQVAMNPARSYPASDDPFRKADRATRTTKNDAKLAQEKTEGKPADAAITVTTPPPPAAAPPLPPSKPSRKPAGAPITVTAGDLTVIALAESDARQVRAGDKGGSLRWGDDWDVQVEPHSRLRLVASDPQSAWSDPESKERKGEAEKASIVPANGASSSTLSRVINLENGQVRVVRRLTALKQRPLEAADKQLPVPVEVVTAAGRMVADDAEFVVSYVAFAAPTGKTAPPRSSQAVRISVVRGTVRLPGGSGKQIVQPGETVTLPVPRKERAP
jgi:hypothetical protein